MMESYFIKYYNSFNNGYNMTLGGEGSLGTKRNWSEKSRENVSGEKHHNYGKKNSKHSKWMSKNKSGINHPMYGKKNPDINAKDYIFIDPKGIEHQIHNATKFCKENRLNRQKMYSVAKGTRKHHKKWKMHRL